MVKKAVKAPKAVKVEEVSVEEVIVEQPHVVTQPYDGTVNTLTAPVLPSLDD